MSTNYGPNQQGQPQWQNPQPFPPQQQNWQGQQFYSPPPMMQQPPPQKKKPRTGCIIGGIVALVIVLALCGVMQMVSRSASTAPDTANIIATSGVTQAPTATQKPAKPLAWHTVQTFSGNGAKKTGTFSVPGDWRIQWKCTPDPTIGQGLLYIGVYNSDGTIVDTNAVGTNCKSGNTTGNTEEHQAGQVYLDVNSGIDWSITVQTLQ